MESSISKHQRDLDVSRKEKDKLEAKVNKCLDEKRQMMENHSTTISKVSCHILTLKASSIYFVAEPLKFLHFLDECYVRNPSIKSCFIREGKNGYQE